MSTDFTARLVENLRAELLRADTKASVLIAAMGLGLGTPLGVSPAGCVSRPSWWLGCTLWVAALSCLLIALIPRYRRSSWIDGAAIASFADIHRAARAGRLTAAIAATELDEAAGLVAAATDLSRIVLLKYRWIRAAVALFTVAASAVALALLGI